MSFGIDMSKYLLRNEKWLGKDGTSDGNGHHKTDGILTDDEVNVFFTSGHLNNEEEDTFISEAEFTNWYNANKDAISSFLSEEYGMDYSSSKVAVYEALQDLAINYLGDYENKVHENGTNNFTDGNFTFTASNGEKEQANIQNLNFDKYIQTVNADGSESVYSFENGKITEEFVFYSNNNIVHYEYDEQGNKYETELEPPPQTGQVNYPNGTAVETPAPANAGDDTTTGEDKKPLPRGVTEDYRRYYEDALAYPSTILTNDDFWNSGISNFGKLEIVKDVIKKWDITDSGVLETIQSHCSEIYLNILNNNKGVYYAERLEELRGSLIENKYSLIELDPKEEMNAIIKFYKNIKDDVLRPENYSNMDAVTSQFESLQSLDHFKISYVADLIQDNYSLDPATNYLRIFADILHNPSTITTTSKDAADNWYKAANMSGARNKRLQKILENTTLSREQKYYLMNKYCFNPDDLPKSCIINGHGVDDFIYDIVGKFKYQDDRGDKEFKEYNEAYVEKFLKILAGM